MLAKIKQSYFSLSYEYVNDIKKIQEKNGAINIEKYSSKYPEYHGDDAFYETDTGNEYLFDKDDFDLVRE